MWSTYSPFLIYRVVVGSRAFGLSTDMSDEDRRGVFLPPAEHTWSLDKPPEQVETSGEGVEEVAWELEKFLRLALQANPNILETLWSPLVLSADPLGQELRDLRECFLSRLIYQTYSGYVVSQFRLMERRQHDGTAFRPKPAMHLVRLLLSGIHAVRHGDILVDVGPHREELLAIRQGERSFEQVRARAEQLVREFEEAFATTRLPEAPDRGRVNRFLIRARRSKVDGTGNQPAG
jgi:predicted nucleotidyltransferase